MPRPYPAFVMRKVFLQELFLLGWELGWLRKMNALCEERHIQLLWEQKLYNLVTFPCWSGTFGF